MLNYSLNGEKDWCYESVGHIFIYMNGKTRLKRNCVASRVSRWSKTATSRRRYSLQIFEM